MTFLLQTMKTMFVVTTLLLFPTLSSSKSILGIDLGSLYMKVAIVQRNSPLEIVTNFHAKRKTEQMILFDKSARRLYGADASSMIGRKPLTTPVGMSLMLGRDDEHPDVKVLSDRHYPLGKPEYNSTRSGVTLKIDGLSYTPEELVSMVLTHVKDMTTSYIAETTPSTSSTDKGAKAKGTYEPIHSTQAFVKDCVLTVPSFYTQHERRALLDAAKLADLNVLALIDETTASALNFGIDRVDVEPKTVLFYNMGSSALQVSVVKYHSYEVKTSKFGTDVKTVGAFEVLGKGWDSTLGGDAFDSRVVDWMVEDFNTMMNSKLSEKKDVRTNIKAMTKLRLQANKAKHVLSANSDFPIFIDGLMNDIPYQSHLTRAHFEELVHDLFKQAIAPVHSALSRAKISLDEVDMIELIGGGMRVPAIQTEITSVLNKELGMHINSDESMALGAAFHGANVSTAFRVRHVGMTDVNPFEMSISLSSLKVEKNTTIDEGTEEGEKSEGILGSLFGIGKKVEEAVDPAAASTEEQPPATETAEIEEEEEVWSKNAVLFTSFGKIGVKKSIAFSHNKDVLCSIDYTENDILPEGTEKAIEMYNITGVAIFAQEMAAKNLSKPKVNLQFELSSSGITRLIKAEATCEEMVMVDVQEEIIDAEDNVTVTVNATEDVPVVDASGTTGDEKGEEASDKEETEKTESADKETEKAESEPSTESEEEAAKTTASSGDNGEDTATPETKDDSATNETKDETAKKDSKSKKKPKKEKKFITVQKEKKKVHKRTLTIKSYHVGRIQPYSELMILESETKLEEMDDKDQALMELEETKNKLESYIYYIKNKLSDEEEEVAKVSTDEQRTLLYELATSTEDWLYEDGYDADLETYNSKYEELYKPADGEIFFRMKEATDRPQAILALQTKMGKVKELMANWKETKPQITDDEVTDVLGKVTKIEEWMKDVDEKQSLLALHETPVFNSTEVPLQCKSLNTLVAKLGKRPKPRPKKVPKNETKTDAKNETTDDVNATDTDTTTKEDATEDIDTPEDKKNGNDQNAEDKDKEESITTEKDDKDDASDDPEL